MTDRTLTAMSKHSESVARLDQLDERLNAGQISANEYAVQRAQLLAVAAETPSARQTGALSTILIVIVALIVCIIVFRIIFA